MLITLCCIKGVINFCIQLISLYFMIDWGEWWQQLQGLFVGCKGMQLLEDPMRAGGGGGGSRINKKYRD